MILSDIIGLQGGQFWLLEYDTKSYTMGLVYHLYIGQVMLTVVYYSDEAQAWIVDGTDIRGEYAEDAANAWLLEKSYTKPWQPLPQPSTDAMRFVYL